MDYHFFLYEINNMFCVYNVYLVEIKFLISPYFLFFDPFETGNTLLCGKKSEHAKLITMHVVPKTHLLLNTSESLRTILKKSIITFSRS